MPKMKKGPKTNLPKKAEMVEVKQPKMAMYKKMADKIAAMKAGGLGKLKGIK